MNITSGTTLRGLLRLRPLSIVILEKHAGYRVWHRLEETLSAFCGEFGIDSDALLAGLSNLPSVPPDTDWDARPIHELIDHLTGNHADFREKDMPAIASKLERVRLPAYPDGYVVKLLLQEFRHFQQEFLGHMDEEEVFLYPKMMRNEACYRFPELEPEAYKGSVNLYLKLGNHRPEDEFRRMIISVGEKLRNQMMHRPAAELTRETLKALESFESRLLAHVELETANLFPRAGRLEQILYENSAPGLSRFPGD